MFLDVEESIHEIELRYAHPTLDIGLNDTLYYPYHHQGGMGKSICNYKGNHNGFRN